MGGHSSAWSLRTGAANDEFHLRRSEPDGPLQHWQPERLIEVLTEMKTYLTLSETELRDLTDGTLDKLAGMTDAEFDALELYPDFI